MDAKARKIMTAACGALSCAAVLYGCRMLFLHMADVFASPFEEMSHGWYVPLFSLYMLFRRRASLRAAFEEGAPSFAGLAAILPCLLLLWTGTRGLQIRFSQAGFIGLCIAMPWALWGRRMARLVAGPALFLVFTVPLGSFLGVLSVPLRLFAVSAAETLLHGFGIETVRTGTVLAIPGKITVDIVEGCSGLRSLFALVTLAAAYGWIAQPTWTRRAILVILAVPVAVAGNVVRNFSICLVGTWYDRDFALGFYHDYSGYVTFIVAIALLLAASDGIARVARRFSRRADPGEGEKDAAVSGKAEEPATAPTPPAPCGRLRSAIPVAAAIAVTSVFAALEAAPPPEYRPITEFSLPWRLPGASTDFPLYCQNPQCANATGKMASRILQTRMQDGKPRCPACGGALLPRSVSEMNILPADTKVDKKIYTFGNFTFSVSAVTGGESKGSIHRPELCLPAHGGLLTDPRDIEVRGIPFHVLSHQKGQSPKETFAYTFFNRSGYRTSSHLARIWRDTADRSFAGEINGWVMVTVSGYAPSGFDTLEDPAAKLEFERFLTLLAPYLEKGASK